MATHETLANHLVPTELISQWEFCICLLDCCHWLDSPSVLQRYQWSISHVGGSYSSCLKKSCILLVVHLKYFPLSYVYVTRSWKSRLVFSTVWAFSLIWAIFLSVVCFLFFLRHTFHMSDILCNNTVVAISLPFNALQGCGGVFFLSLSRTSNFYFFGYFKLIESQNVYIHLNFLSTLFDGYSFAKAAVISSDGTKESYLLFITPFKVFSLFCRYALHFVVWKVLILWILFGIPLNCPPPQTNCCF